MNIRNIYVSLFQQGDETLKARKELFIEQRKQLLTRMADMQKTLERLDYKISIFEQKIVERERTLRRSEV